LQTTGRIAYGLSKTAVCAMSIKRKS
jgi:hypothetical protein